MLCNESCAVSASQWMLCNECRAKGVRALFLRCTSSISKRRGWNWYTVPYWLYRTNELNWFSLQYYLDYQQQRGEFPFDACLPRLKSDQTSAKHFPASSMDWNSGDLFFCTITVCIPLRALMLRLSSCVIWVFCSLSLARLTLAPRPRTSVHYQGIPESRIWLYSFVQDKTYVDTANTLCSILVASLDILVIFSWHLKNPRTVRCSVWIEWLT
jgi:hypothetical protein